MSTTELKVQIFESLDGLDKPQSEKVLAFIRSIIDTRSDNEDYANFKQRAMSQIRTALNQSPGPKAA